MQKRLLATGLSDTSNQAIRNFGADPAGIVDLLDGVGGYLGPQSTERCSQ
jgi:hypothetical protein